MTIQIVFGRLKCLTPQINATKKFSLSFSHFLFVPCTLHTLYWFVSPTRLHSMTTTDDFWSALCTSYEQSEKLNNRKVLSVDGLQLSLDSILAETTNPFFVCKIFHFNSNRNRIKCDTHAYDSSFFLHCAIVYAASWCHYYAESACGALTRRDERQLSQCEMDVNVEFNTNTALSMPSSDTQNQQCEMAKNANCLIERNTTNYTLQITHIRFNWFHLWS